MMLGRCLLAGSASSGADGPGRNQRPRSGILQQICGSEVDFSKHTLQASFDGGSKAMPKTLPSTAIVRSVVALTPGGVESWTERRPDPT